MGFRARTEFEVRRKLESSGFSEEQIHSALDKLKSYRYLNDEELARNWTCDRTVRDGYGPLFVERELRRRGVAPQLIERVVAEAFGAGEELARAREFVAKRFAGEDLASLKILKRAQALLARRGYHPETVAEALGYRFEEV